MKNFAPKFLSAFIKALALCCIVLACNTAANAQCIGPQITCSGPITILTNNGACQYCDLGLFNNLQPAPIASPITLDLIDRFITFTGTSLNGGGNFAVMQPGASGTLSFTMDVSFSGGYCPDCSVQTYIGLGGTSQTLTCNAFVNDQLPGGSYHAADTVSFAAPYTPGLYYLVLNGTLDFQCVPQDFGYKPNYAIGLIIVSPVPAVSDTCASITSLTSDAPACFPEGSTTVNWTVTDALGGTASCQQQVQVNPASTLSIACPGNMTVDNDPAACGATVNFTAAGNNCSSPVTVISTPASGSFFPVGITTVNTTATDTFGNSTSCSFTVTVIDTTSRTITGTPTACGQVTLTASGGTGYTWSGGSSTNTATDTFTISGTYTVTVTGNGCAATLSQVVLVNPIPATVSVTGNTTGCNSTVLTAHCSSISGNIPCTGYNADVIANGNGTSFNTSTVGADGTFAFVSQDFNPGNGYCASGGDGLPVSGQIASTSGTGITYTLQDYSANNDLFLSGGSSGTLNLVAPVTASTLYVVCTSGNGSGNFVPTIHFADGTQTTLPAVFVPDWCSNTPSLQLTSQTYFRDQRTNSTFCFGGEDCQHLFEIPITGIPTSSAVASITFANSGGFLNVFALGQIPSNGQFIWSGGQTPNAAANTFTASGTYNVRATTTSGCSTSSAPFTVTIDSTSISASGGGQLCYGDSLTLTSTPGTTYQWNDGATTQSITVNSNGSYTVTTNGCQAVSPVVVLVHQAPYITTNGPTTFCPGFSLQLTANPAGTYLWSTGETTSTISVNTAATFSVSMISNDGCHLDTFITTQISQLPPVQLSSGLNFTLCPFNGNVDIETNGNPLYAHYLWSNGTSNANTSVTDTGIVSVTVSDVLGCSVSASADVTSGVVGNPSIYGQGVWNVYAWNAGDAIIDSNDWNKNYSGYYVDNHLAFNSTNYWCNTCSPSNAAGYQGCTVSNTNMSFSAQRQGFPCGYYRIDIPGHDDASQLFINGALVWVDSGCCDVNMNVWRGFLDGQTSIMFRTTQGAGQAYGIMAITALPDDSLIIASAPLTFCPGFAIQLNAGYAAGYLWSTGETTQVITVPTAGTVTVTVTDGANCSLTLSDTIVTTISALPVPQLAGGYCAINHGAGVYITNASPLYVNYSWSDGATTVTPGHFFSDTGVVDVTVSDVLGCTVSGSEDIISSIVGDPAVYGQGVWNVYAWNAGDPVIDSNDWSQQYSGYYVDTNLAFNSTSYWCKNCTPADAAGYQGCPVNPYNISYSAQRQGFPCAYYRIDVVAHDDAAQLFVDGNLVWVDSGCCNGSANVWRGMLGANSQVMFRVTQGGAVTDGIIAITALSSDSLISASGPGTFCAGYAIQLTAVNGAGYLWSTGDTSQSITVSTAGTFTVSVSEPQACSNLVGSIVTKVQPLPVPQLAGGYCANISGANIHLNSPSPLYATYKWGDGTTNSTDFVSDTGEVYVTISDALGCTVSDSLDVTQGVVGDPSVNGNGVWNVYVWNAGTANLDTTANWNQQYSGYYVDTNLAYNSTNYFCNSCAPSDAPGYIGCAVSQTSMSYSARRQGFPCGYYRIDIPSHDDAAQLFVNGTLVWQDLGCCDINLNVWKGILDANTQVTFRITQGYGGSNGIMAITALPDDSVIVALGVTSLCSGQSVTLNAPAGTSYLWSTGATTQSITVSTEGTYDITFNDGGICPVNASVAVSIIKPVISGCTADIAVANDAGVCGAVVNFNTPVAQDLCSNDSTVSFVFTGQYQTWTVPANVYTVQIDAAGATGSGGSGGAGGNGGRVITNLSVTPGQVLYVNVGGAGNGTAAGYNGGGAGSSGYYGGGGGGGGFTSIGTTGIILTDTLVIAAGGGGGGDDCGNETGGAGGYPYGTAGLNCGNPDGGGATQSSGGTSAADPGSFFQAGAGVFVGYYGSGGGGGGYYGGGGGQNGGGGGGSSYVSAGSNSNTVYAGGYNSAGNGYLTISYGVPFNAVQTAGPASGSTFPVGVTTVTFTATDNSGGSSACSFNVTVSDTEAPVISCPGNITANAAAGACGTAVTFSATATDNCSATVASTPASGSVFPIGTTTVTSVATDAAGNTDSCQFTVTVNPTPVSASASVCNGSSYNFNGTLLTLAGLYTDTIPSSTGCDSIINLTLTVNPAPATPVIIAGGLTTICPGSRVKLTASAGTSYHWSTGATTQAIFAQASGNYIVTVYNSSGCGAASSPTVVTQTASPIPTISAVKPTTFCQGGSVVLSSSSGALYQWNTGATTKAITVKTSGSYTVTVTLNGQCSGSAAPEVVTVNPLPIATVTASGPTTFCTGGSVSLTASSAPSYLWSNNATTPSITVSSTGPYRVTLTSAQGCSKASAVTRVVVHALPNATISATSTELCNGDSIKLTARPGVSWNWSTGATTRIIEVHTADSYDVTVTAKNTCSNSSAPLLITDCGAIAGKTDNGESDGSSVTPIALSNTFDVTVYPNPYTGQFHLKVLSSTTENINVKIYDITGKLLEERREMPYGTDVILGNGYAAGVYIIETNQADRVKVMRVVKVE